MHSGIAVSSGPMRWLSGRFAYLLIVVVLPALSPAMGAETAAPRVALVLSGGGARGLAQIGVLQALDQAGIKPSLIVANSMGAVIGGLYSAGYSPDSLAKLCSTMDWEMFFRNTAERRNTFMSHKTEPVDYLLEIRFKRTEKGFAPLFPSSLSHGQTFYDFLSPRLSPAQYRGKMNFDSLGVPLRVATTDLVTGKPVILAQGDLATAIRASSGVPLAFSPVEVDDMLLIDGGITANIPVRPALAEGADYVIAVDVTSPMWTKELLNNPLRIADQIVNIGITQHKDTESKLADFVIVPELDGFLNTDFSRTNILIAKGHSAAQECIPSILADLSRIAAPQSENSTIAGQVQLPIRWVNSDSSFSSRLDSVVSLYLDDGDGHIHLDTLRRAVHAFFDDIRMPFARVARVSSGDPAALVTLDYAVVTRIKISGNSKTSTRLILSLVDVELGDTLNVEALSRAQTAVYGTNLFKSVNVHALPDGIVTVDVKEKEYFRVRTAARYDESHFLEAYVTPAFENLFGWGVLTSLHLQYGLRREKYALDLLSTQPFTRLMASIVRFQAYISREKIRDESSEVAGPDTATVQRFFLQEMDLRKAGLIAAIGTEVGKSAMLEAGVRLEQFRVDRSEGSVFEDPLFPFRYGLRYLMVRLVVDNTDEFYFPVKGQKHYFKVGGAHDALGGTERFLKIDASLSGFVTFARKHTFCPRLHFTWSSDTLPDVERLFLGGVPSQEKYQDMGVFNHLSFVGLANRAWPGDIVFLTELSYRYQLRKNLYVVAVLDWGYAWAYGQFSSNMSTVESYFDRAPVGVGLGLAASTVVGPIRIGWGRVFRSERLPEILGLRSENRFYLSAGHDF